jgi:hypothetical protein
MPRETGKQRQSRIDLRYYQVPDRQARWRNRVALLALLAATSWVVMAPILGPDRVANVRFFQHSRLASKGPLARSHAMWEAKCEACHVPFTPINESRWTVSLASGPHGRADRCQTCHAGPSHHASQKTSDVPSCAECHADHRGRDASLLTMDDSACTSCHRDLSRHRDPAAGPMQTAASVTRFDADSAHHPGFTPPSGVPGPASGRIKFSHARHMAKGLTIQPGAAPFTFAFLNEPDRARYGWTHGRDEEPIQLRCDTCHRFDAEDDAARLSRIAKSFVPTRAPGASMLPVAYEKDCRACHPLSFDANDRSRHVRHGVQPRELVDELRQFYAAQIVNGDSALLHRFVPPRPMPGRPAPPEVDRADKAAAQKTLVALKRLFSAAVDEDVRSSQGVPLGRGGCVECHDLTPTARQLVDLEAASSLEVKPVVVRSLWYESASFNHATHRALECAACHPGASESKDQTRSLLPDIGGCVGCHAPATISDGRQQGGAGVSCVECHRYHNGDHPAQGVGARARRGTLEKTVEQFLSGELPPGD